MKVWIVWLPNVWKSTLFNVLTKSYSAPAENFPFCTIEPNVGIVNVNDERLELLRKVVSWAKNVPATVEFIDIAWLVKWASTGEWLGNKFLSNIREVDAILQVVRFFNDPNVTHVSGEINPKNDIEIINSELILADLETLEKRMSDNLRKARSNDKEAATKQEIYEKLKSHLEKWNLAINLDLSLDEKELIYDLFLLSNKPFIYAINLDETKLNLWIEELRLNVWISDKNIPVIPICVKLELDMMWFSLEERKEYLDSMWIKSNPIDELIKTCYDSLGLQYYFTAWEIEVKAWTIKKGTKAPGAAWKIHSDFEKKFIKADVVNWKDLVDFWGWHQARENGKVRLEWKEYIVQDWDVMIFKFGG